MRCLSEDFPSNAGHVEPGMNPGGPPPKAKYYLATDSETVARAKGEKNPCKGSEKFLKPCTYTAVGGLCRGRKRPECLTACLSVNDPASQPVQLG